MAKDDGKHGADRIPGLALECVELLLQDGHRDHASWLLAHLATEYKLKSYEAHHLATHLLQRAGCAENATETGYERE